MKIYFMRHGETDLNREQKLQGQMDCPLNEVGIRQAQEMGEKLHKEGFRFDRVYSSTLDRAIVTAMYAAKVERQLVIQDADLLEIDYGPYEGAHFSELKPDMFAFFKNPEHVEPPEGVESIHDLLKRSEKFLNMLIKLESEKSNVENILVVTHGVEIRGLMRLLQEKADMAVWGMPVDNCTLYETKLEEGKFSPICVCGEKK